MQANLDDSVGAVLGKIDAEGLRDNTLVIFFSDNGGPTRELTSSNAPLRGEKGTVYENGLRVPFLIRWPGTYVPGSVVDDPASALDIVPTVAAAVGAPLPKCRKYDGVDLAGHNPFEHYHEHLFWRIGTRHALRKGDWKILRQRGGGWELFNLAEDISESKNLAKETPEKLAELVAAWEKENAEMVDPLWKP